MEKKVFSLYDVVVNSIKVTLGNIRLWTLTSLSMLFSVAAVVVLAGIFFWSIGKALVEFNKQAALSGITDKVLIMKKCLMIIAEHPIALILGLFILIVGILGLGLGSARFAFDMHDKGTSSPLRLFSCFHLVPKAFVIMIIILPAILLGFLFFIIPGLYLSIRLRFVSEYLVDKNAGIMESIKRSFNATRGIEWDLFGLMLISRVLMAITFVFVIPVSLMMGIGAYRQVQK